jgi:flagellin-like protein
MKRIWKMRRDSEAVSPVIATILMVAITVVLAAVLYVMVMGFGGPTTTTPTGSFVAAEKHSATAERIRFGVITPDTPPSSLKIVIENPEGVTKTFTWNANGYWENNTADDVNLGIKLNYTDLAANNIINTGDYFYIDFPSSGSITGVYRVTMLYAPTGAVIDDITFNW